MKIAVCVKTLTGAAVDMEDAFLRVGRTLPSVLPPFDAHAVEEALRIRERRGQEDEILLLAVGPREGLGGLKQALAMGADRAVLVADPKLADADISGVSTILAALVRREAPDLTLFCPWSGDIDGTLLVAMTAARLGIPSLGPLRSLAIDAATASGTRQTEGGDEQLGASLPCLAEISDATNKPRNPTLNDRRRANAKPIELLGLADLLPEANPASTQTRIIATTPAPSSRHPRIVEQQDAADQVIALLRERRLLT
jgi:electron transfer flavoprotein beta subunit